MTQDAARHFAFLAFPDVGHLKPTLEVARELAARGHRVTYLLDEDFAAMASESGAAVLGFASGRRRYGDRSFEDIGSLGIDYMERVIDTALPLARKAFETDPPDVVVYDYENFVAARALSHELGIPSVQFFPYLASNDAFSLRGEMFQFDFDNALVQRTVGILTGFLADNGMPPEAIWTFAREYDERNLAFIPRRFQVKGEEFDDRFAFVGPCFAPAADLAWTPPAPERRTVLISLGTEANDQPELLAACATAFAGGDWHVVLTLGRGRDTEALTSLGDDIEAHEWFPHTALLPHVDVLVCHGGMTSTMEALAYGVPVVVLPMTFENGLNGRQVAELGLGALISGPETVTREEIREAAERVAASADTRAALEAMRSELETAGGVSAACDYLEAAG